MKPAMLMHLQHLIDQAEGRRPRLVTPVLAAPASVTAVSVTPAFVTPAFVTPVAHSHLPAEAPARVATGIAAIDQALDPQQGRGLVLDALHEVRMPTALDAGAGAGFALALAHLSLSPTSPAGKTGANRPALFWITGSQAEAEGGRAHGPGIGALGFANFALVRVVPANIEDALWAAGELAACRFSGAGLLELRGNPEKFDLSVTRRLMFACRRTSRPFFVLRQSGDEEASAATTRWRVTAARSSGVATGLGAAAWHITLEKCRGGATGQWTVEWNSDEQALVSVDGRDAIVAPIGPPLPGLCPAAAGERPDRAATLGQIVALERAS